MTLGRVQETWENLAQTDPFWAILAEPEFKGNRWTVNDFFQTGVAEIDGVMATLATFGLPTRGLKALDFGCGAGRLTQPLARHFEQVWGVDISPTMIELAKRLDKIGDRGHFLVNPAPDLRIFEDGFFDMVYSRRTLMHIPRRLIPGYISELLRVTSRSGVLVFHLPSGPKNRVVGLFPAALIDPMFNLLRAVRYRLSRRGEAPWEMHWISRTAVRRILIKDGGFIRNEVDVPSGGGALTGVVFYVTRPNGASLS
jgi:ubiquinone/menaquinone biosynthesis C-methylase UbiE